MEIPVEQWQKVIDINLTGPFLMMKAAIPHMIKNGGGSIINISSLAGIRCIPAMPAYTASKSGLIGTVPGDRPGLRPPEDPYQCGLPRPDPDGDAGAFHGGPGRQP